MSKPVYVVAAERPWQVAAFHSHVPDMQGQWELIDDPSALTSQRIESLSPRRIFFTHWSHRIPAEIHRRWECILFHMTDVPYGRGGSPLQNLIVRGHTDTMMSAIRVVEQLDAGPVYLKRPLSLAGSAREIFERAARLTWEMIDEIVTASPEPEPQSGEATVFRRREPHESRLPRDGGANAVYDHIRMLDADGYPPAFIDHGEFRLELDRATLEKDGSAVTARVRISRHGPDRGEDEGA